MAMKKDQAIFLLASIGILTVAWYFVWLFTQ